MLILSGWWQKRRNAAAVRFRRGPNGFCPRYRQNIQTAWCSVASGMQKKEGLHDKYAPTYPQYGRAKPQQLGVRVVRDDIVIVCG